MPRMSGTVVSDLEGTISAGETWRGVARYLNDRGRRRAWRLFLATHVPVMLLVRMRLLDRARFRDLWIRDQCRLLRGLSEDELAAMGEWVVEHELWPQRREAVVAELQAHVAAGRRLLIVSGTYQPVIRAVAARLGGEAMGTELEMRGGRATGRAVGEVNTGRSKTRRLGAILGAEPVAAYGDTEPDERMLLLAEEPVAVHPDHGLSRIARERGWRVIAD
jgi:HAD superfamily phosphoserine phosphatase-like hydrolase